MSNHTMFFEEKKINISCGAMQTVQKLCKSNQTIYSKILMTRTPMARLPWMIRTRF